MTQQGDHLGQRREAGLTLVAAALSLAAVVVGMVWFEQVWEGEPYAVADPAATAERLDGYTQTTYDALNLPQAELDGEWPGGVSVDGYHCGRRGLRHWSDELAGSPPSAPHVVDVRYDWALAGVLRTEAVLALGRARQALTRQGWKVTAYENSRSRLRLSLKPPAATDAVSIQAYPGDRLQVAAHADCARYPSGTPVDDLGKPELPIPQAPAQLRG